MSRRTTTLSGAELLACDDVTVRWQGRAVFARTRWTWRRGEQWAVLGPNGAGKSVLALALCGKAPVVRGEIHYPFGAVRDEGAPAPAPEEAIALLSPATQRDLATHEGSFYQSRWHSGLVEGQRTVAQFLSPASVADLNPFEVGARREYGTRFRERQRLLRRWLGLDGLLRRRLISLSNGEQRKVLLAHTLLRSPRLLILDDPFGGLDAGSRARLRAVIHRLMRARLPVLLLTSRPDEIPPGTTHLLLVQHHRVVAQGSKAALLNHPLARQLALAGAPRLRDAASGVPALAPRPRGPLATHAAPPLIELNHVTVRLGRQRVLDDVTWTMRRGEHWALLGPNGSGKTTLLSLIQGDNPQAYAADLRLFGARPHSTQTLWRTRQQIGWVSPELHLHYPPGWPCLDVVCSGFHNMVGLHQPATPRQRRAARSWLQEFGLGDQADTAFGELSLGDQRLVLLARAVVKPPKLLILDEPCQGLDAAHRHAVLARVDRLVQRTGASLIFVTHHAGEMPACITRVLRLKGGRVENADGRPTPSLPVRRKRLPRPRSRVQADARGAPSMVPVAQEA